MFLTDDVGSTDTWLFLCFRRRTVF